MTSNHGDQSSPSLEPDTDDFDPVEADLAIDQSRIDNPGDYDFDEAVDTETGEIRAPIKRSQSIRSTNSPLTLVEDKPYILVAKSYQLSNQLPGLLNVARRVTRGAIGTGIVISMPQMKPATASAFFARCSDPVLKIADPTLHQHPSSGSPTAAPPSGRTLRGYQWFGLTPAHADPTDQTWVKEVIDAQVAVGASILLSATSWVDAADPARQLAHAMRWVQASRAEAEDRTMLVNLTLDSTWLSNRSLRSQLLTEILESDERSWYLRFYWPEVEPRYGQLADEQILLGYRELATLAALEGKRVFLANSGLTGWIATALGATGFSTGIGWPEQAYAAQRRIASRRGRPQPPRVPRYFENTLMHTVDHPFHVAISAQTGYSRCSCRYCASLPLGAPLAGTWPKETAGLHYLLRVAKLTQKVSGPNPRLEALREVRGAEKFVATLKATASAPTGGNTPKHLAQWSKVLA